MVVGAGETRPAQFWWRRRLGRWRKVVGWGWAWATTAGEAAGEAGLAAGAGRLGLRRRASGGAGRRVAGRGWKRAGRLGRKVVWR